MRGWRLLAIAAAVLVGGAGVWVATTALVAEPGAAEGPAREEVLERVTEVLVEQLGIDGAEITEEASLAEDLGTDWLDHVELIMEVEDQFGIRISDDEARELRTAGQIVDFVMAHV
jgi:acyl carrier protein